MRFLTKFYSFIKSVYLNNSKYSNNLSHTLRIFFEREVKTKNTPALFGSTFKGSKWTDYQTFNINKLFVKSGLTYFYYILITLVVTFLLLGRSKAEQYFGFLPFFSYVNFMLGYAPLVLADTTSQVIVIVYSLYTFIYKFFYKKLTSFISNTLFSENTNHVSSYTKLISIPKNNNNKSLINTPNWFTKNTTNSSTIISVSKILSQLRNDILTLDKFNWRYFGDVNVNLSTLPLLVTRKHVPLNKYIYTTVTASESVYTGCGSISNYKIRNTAVTLSYLNNLHKVYHLPNTFDFNIKPNLDISNQQRWLTKNSLLTESIVHNSFIFTQAKKLIGTGLLNKDLTNQTLWLPTKSSHLSSTETSLYFSNLLNSTDNFFNSKDFLKNYQINNSSFTNLNFFENSRLWLMKKYFFTNNLNTNMVYELPKPSYYTTVGSKNELTPTKLTFNLSLYKASLHYMTKSTLSPSLNKLVSTTLPETTYNPHNLLTVNTPNLDIFNSNTNQFFFLLTSNFCSTNQTVYYSYWQSNIIKLSQTNTTKFTVV